AADHRRRSRADQEIGDHADDQDYQENGGATHLNTRSFGASCPRKAKMKMPAGYGARRRCWDYMFFQLETAARISSRSASGAGIRPYSASGESGPIIESAVKNSTYSLRPGTASRCAFLT